MFFETPLLGIRIKTEWVDAWVGYEFPYAYSIKPSIFLHGHFIPEGKATELKIEKSFRAFARSRALRTPEEWLHLSFWPHGDEYGCFMIELNPEQKQVKEVLAGIDKDCNELKRRIKLLLQHIFGS